VFFNEGLVLLGMHSFGLEAEWQTGVDRQQLFERVCFISNMLKQEEFIKDIITKDKPEIFDAVIN
jgi:hypothetical protein